MAITAANIITRVQTILQDDTGIRWPSAELLLWISDAQREICLLKPDASAINDIVKLRANTTKQTMAGIELDGTGNPPTGNRFLRVVRNIHTTDFADNTGNGAGRSIRLVSRRVLDSQYPDWHDPSAATGDAAFISNGGNIKHYVFDEIDPQTFYVFPGVAANQAVYVEIVYSGVPADVASTSDAIDLPDVYANCITDYVCYRAFSKEADYASNAQRATSHYNAFASAIGVKAQGDNSTSPNVTVNFGREDVGNPTSLAAMGEG
jgi:hypothetical protein